MNTSCVFCNSIQNILEETENFYVKVGIGIVTAGHVMIIPKYHYKAMGAIEKHLINEYLLLKERVYNNISNLFSEPFLVEYGAYAQSVFHAHVHFIPKTGDGYKNVDIVKDILLKAKNKINFDLIKINNFNELCAFYSIYHKYIYFEDKSMYLVKINDDVKNNINFFNYRKFFTELGLKGILSWAEMNNEDKKYDLIKINKTIEEYKKILK